jgi:hypothetical protein
MEKELKTAIGKVDDMLAALEKKLEEQEKAEVNVDLKPVSVVPQDSPENGTVIFYLNESGSPARDYLVSMWFPDENEKDAMGKFLYIIGEKIVGRGAVSFSLDYYGSDSKKKRRLALSNVIGLNTDIIAPESFTEEMNRQQELEES